MALCIEGAELMEIFQWSGEQDISTILNDRRNDIENEIADIAIILSYFCHDLGIDLEKSIETKLLENSRKYPIEKARGKSTKYDRL